MPPRATVLVKLTGYYPDEQTHQDMLAAIGRRFVGSKLNDELKPGKGAPKDFAEAASAMLQQLSRLSSGVATMSDTASASKVMRSTPRRRPTFRLNSPPPRRMIIARLLRSVLPRPPHRSRPLNASHGLPTSSPKAISCSTPARHPFRRLRCRARQPDRDRDAMSGCPCRNLRPYRFGRQRRYQHSTIATTRRGGHRLSRQGGNSS